VRASVLSSFILPLAHICSTAPIELALGIYLRTQILCRLNAAEAPHFRAHVQIGA
jgi:hypothetical protein